MNIMNIPTCEDLWNDDVNYKSIYREADDSWRHGSYITEVFHRSSDNTYWMAGYRKSGDGEYNELREGEADIIQVEPFERVVVDYRPIVKSDT